MGTLLLRSIRNISEEAETDKNEKWTSFALEEDLRHLLVRNLSLIEPGLVLYRDKNGNEGDEYHTAVGDIDVLAVDAKGDFVVFELKISRGSDATVGQLLRYIGWVQKQLALDKKVRGIILANEIDEKLRYAAGATLFMSMKFHSDSRPQEHDRCNHPPHRLSRFLSSRLQESNSASNITHRARSELSGPGAQ